MLRFRTTYDEYQLHQLIGGEWNYILSEETRTEALCRRKEYILNMPGTYRVVKRRLRKTYKQLLTEVLPTSVFDVCLLSSDKVRLLHNASWKDATSLQGRYGDYIIRHAEDRDGLCAIEIMKA